MKWLCFYDHMRISLLFTFSLWKRFFNMCIIMFFVCKALFNKPSQYGETPIIIEGTRLDCAPRKCGRKLILLVFLRRAKCLRKNGAKTNKDDIANRN